MSEPKKVINPADLDAALQKIEKSFSETAITLEKSVDKRAMGGDQKDEANNEEIASPGDDRKGQPKVGAGTRAVSKLQGNWAERYPMDSSKAEGEGLEAAVADSAKAPTRDKEPVNKAVEQSAEPGEMSKAVDASSSSSSSMKKAVDNSTSSSSSKSSKSSSKKMKKAVDGSSYSSSMSKAVVPHEASAESSGASSGAPQLKIKKSIKLIKSANKHLSKAYESGSDTELEIAGDRLVEAKTSILKAMKDGVKVSEDIVKSLDKAAKHFGKALGSFENDNIKQHIKDVEKSQKYMLKAISAYDFQKSATVEKAVEKSVKTDEIKFVHKDGKVVAQMTEEQFKNLAKSLNEKGLYKSFLDTMSAKDKNTIDALPIVKSLVDGLKESQDSLRDNLNTKLEKDQEFKKSVTEALNILSKTSKQNLEDIEKLKKEPAVRKSILTEVKSPLDGGKAKGTIEKSQVMDILIKGKTKGYCNDLVLLSWDVDKDLTEEIPQKYVDLCERIQRS